MYELLYIVPSPFTEKDLPKILNQTKELIEKFGGKVINRENLGNKKLAYPIKHIRRGFYILVYFEMEPQNLKEFNQKLRLSSEILRFLIVKFTPVKKASKIRGARTKSIPEADESKPPAEKIDLKTIDEKIDKLLDI